MVTFPLFLTFIRLLLAPFMMPFLIIYWGTSSYCVLHLLLAGVFLVFSITDFLDGYLARRFNQVSVLGKILDPIADKSLLFAALIGLLVIQKIYFLWVIIFIGREIFLMGLRLAARERGLQISVSFAGKLKTVSQMFYVTVLLIKPCFESSAYASQWYMVQQGALLAALGLSLGSAYLYYRTFIREVALKADEDIHI